LRTHGLVLATAVLLTLSALPAAASEVADTAFINGRFYTLEAKSTIASAVAVKDGRFIAVGDDLAVRPSIGSATRVVDLHGQAVIPGLNDSHDHFLAAGEKSRQVALQDTKSVAEALARIKSAAAAKKPGEWVLGSPWHPPSQLAEHRYLTRTEIDSVAPNNPVYLQTVGHVAMFNSAALAIGGINAKTPNPQGGVIERTPTGEPDGVLFEHAIDLVSHHVPAATAEDLDQEYILAMKYANSLGLTSILDPADNIRALQRIALSGRSTLRIGANYWPDSSGSIEQWAQLMDGNGASSGFGDEWLRFIAIGELNIDGGMTLRTAFTRAAYPDDPKYFGQTTMSKERLIALVSEANKHDWRLDIHCVGDAACDWVLDAYEAANKEKSIIGRRFGLMHGSLMHKDQFDRAKKLGVILQLQNAFLWTKASTVERFLGHDAANRAIPDRLAIDTLGIDNVALGTDFPINDMNPFIGLYIATTRKDIDGHIYGDGQQISREEALRLYTQSGAFATFEEKLKGSIETGKLADMVVIDKDYMVIPQEEIKTIMPVETIVGGQVVYQR